MKNSKLILIAFTIVYTLNSGNVIARDKPNIVLIIIDDLGWKDVGYMGSTYYETPNIDRLAGQGMIFTNAYANAANCAPTRACLLSGQYTPRHGVYTVARPDRGKSEDRRLIPVVNSRKISLDKITIAEALKPVGYVSAAKYETKDAEGCHGDATYAAMIESVDESVRDIYKTLGDLGLSENTILIFFSDNGGHGTYTCQKPLRGGKGMFYEGGIRVPMFVHWPGKVRGGTKCDFPVIGTDFYPTFMELAGVQNPYNYPLDGESIVRLLEGKNSIKRDAVFWHFPAYLEAYDGLKDESRDPVFRTRPVSVIRKGDWKLLMFHEEWVLDGGQDKINSNNSVELYNLKKDPGESKNLRYIKNNKRDKLLKHLLEWQDEINAPIPQQANPDYIEK